MTAKRALVVDDSRSARISLQKMLERYQIVVDFAESGEEALDYLKHHLVDAIFMDHTMPGMDGLETVVAIKSNPRTATIPVMMYTAKEGEVYVSQARALGAIGVLPKQVQPGVLEEMLRKLGLLRAEGEEVAGASEQERAGVEHPAKSSPSTPAVSGPLTVGEAIRSAERSQQNPQARPLDRMREREEARYAEAAVNPEYDQQALGASVQALITRVLSEQHVRLRSDILTAHRDFARQVAAEILAKERVPSSTEPSGVAPQAAVGGRGRRRLSVAWLLLLPLLGLAVFCWQLMNERAALTTTMVALQDTVAQRDVDMAALRAARTSDLDAQREQAHSRYVDLVGAVEWALNRDGLVAFDQPAFDDRRAAELETLLGDLVDAGFRGTVRLESHLGDFCLTAEPEGPFGLAAPGTALEDCSRMGHPLDDSRAAESRQSAAFASFVANSPLATGSGIEVQIVAHDRDSSVAAEPIPPGIATAGEWNDAARRNHRVQYSIVPEGG